MTMKLLSCDGCGLVYDVSKRGVGDIRSKETGEVLLDRAAWDGYEWVPMFKCGVCETEILISGE